MHRVAGVSVVGARHLANGQGGQDAVCFRALEGGAVAAVADGHGEARYSRSDVGSRLAAETACELLALVEAPLSLELLLHVGRRIAWEWNRKVKADLGQESPDGAWGSELEAYGTTLVAGLLLDGRLGLLKLGDGDALVDGVQIFEDDPELYGTATRSLCSSDGVSHLKVALRPQGLLLLSTDGVRDSLGSLEKLGPWLEMRLEKEGFEAVIESLPGFLAELSHRGNGDDASLALIAPGDTT